MAYEPEYDGWERRVSHADDCPALPTKCACPGATDLWIASTNPPLGGFTNSAGKWCAFVDRENADDLWLVVRDATIADELGFATKVSFKDPKRSCAIMAYTVDAEDEDDKNRVRARLRELLHESGLILDLKYKTDAATRAGEFSRLDPLGRGTARRGGPIATDADIVTPCYFFSTKGGCDKGDACTYKHVVSSGGGRGGGRGSSRGGGGGGYGGSGRRNDDHDEYYDG